MQLRKKILSEYFAENPNVLRDRKVVVMAGPPGAGKSSARRDRISASEEQHWRFIDPDEFKTRLLRHARQTGEYDSLIPPEVQARIAAGEKFAPGEFASLVHEESSAIARMAVETSVNRGERVVIDGINGSTKKITARIDELATHGYTDIDIICVDGPRDVTRARVINRWADGYSQFEGGNDAGFNARYVPEHITDELYRDEQRFSSCTRATAEATRAAREPLNVRADIYYVDDPNGAAVLWKSYRKDGEGAFTHKTHQKIQPIAARTSPGAAPATSPVAAADGGGGGGEIYVAGYTRADGVHVAGYTRKRAT